MDKNINKNILDNIKNIFFIGIGGSGMFPLAQILKSKNFSISGSDVSESYITEIEKSLGMKIYIGHDKRNISGSDLVVYSAAIKKDNVELLEAKKLGIKILERAKLLGILASEKSKSVGVCGTHGKTTTTALITHVLLKLKKDPSAIIGGKLSEIGGNARVGKSDIMICEACEYVDTFLNLYPQIATILNIDEDHMEYFKTIDNVINSYNKFCNNTSDIIICNGDDINCQKLIKNLDKNLNKQLLTFGLDKNNDYYVDDMSFGGYENNKFNIYFKNKKIATVILNIPGKHNILNSLAAFVTCLELGCRSEDVVSAIKTFRGVCRRFEILGKFNGAIIADDYAHHPKEIEVTLNSAKKLGFNKIWAIFQPFTFSRTFLLLDEFASSLSIADEILLTPIMGAREVNTYNISSQDLASKINIKTAKCSVFENFDLISEYIKNNVGERDLVLTMGCGDIYKCAKKILS